MKKTILLTILLLATLKLNIAKAEDQCVDFYSGNPTEINSDFHSTIDKAAKTKLDQLTVLLTRALNIETSNLSLMSEFLTMEAKKVNTEISTGSIIDFAENQSLAMITDYLDVAQKRINQVESMAQPLTGFKNFLARKKQRETLKNQITEILSKESSSASVLLQVKELSNQAQAKFDGIKRNAYVLAKEVEKMEKLIETILTAPNVVKDQTSLNFMLEHLMSTITSLNQTLVLLASTERTLAKQIAIYSGIEKEINLYGETRLNKLADDFPLIKATLIEAKKRNLVVSDSSESTMCITGGICIGEPVIFQYQGNDYRGTVIGIFPSGKYSLSQDGSNTKYEIDRSKIAHIKNGQKYRDLTTGSVYSFKYHDNIYEGTLFGIFPDGDLSIKLYNTFYRIKRENVAAQIRATKQF